jgi:hypothetical protein
MKRTLIFAGTLAIILSAVVLVLGILDVKSFKDLWGDLGKVLTILAVCTGATLLIYGLVGLVKGKS